MKNKATTTYKWAYLPFVFSSAAILATSVQAAPGASQQYQDAKQVGSANYEYVGGRTQIGLGVTDDGDASVDLNHVFSETQNSSTSAGLWAGYDLSGDDKGLKGRGVQVNHNWVSRDSAGRATHVNKVFGAYDRNEAGHDKATVGYGQENESLFWEGHVSKGLSGKKGARVINGKTVRDKAYDYGVGGSVGTFYKDSNVRVRAGLDHEWGDDVGAGEDTATNTTLSAGIEKFFQGTPHSVALDVAASRRNGGYETGSDDTDVTGKLSYRYDFGGASIYQPDRRYRRVRVEVPGSAGVAPRYAKKAQFKRIPTYKTVNTYGKKTIRTPYKQLVKSTMELEGQTFFKLNSAKLIPSAQTRLKQIASQIRKNGYKGSIRITGNTCGLGDPVYDQRLSEQRARAVRSFLIKNGFNANHLIARGLGKGHPKYPNTPDQGFKNRRVDIEYISERKAYKTGYRTETRNVRTGSRRVATGFKNVPAGFKDVMISGGRAGGPSRVIWRTEAIATSPAWVTRALHNNIQHNTSVNTYQTTAGSQSSNSAPVVVNDKEDIQCSTAPVTIDVLANDSDIDGDTLTISNVTNGAFGTTEVVNGMVVYTPSANACGQSDSFNYTVSDGHGNSSTATVSVNIAAAAANNAPNAVNDSATTNQGESVVINALVNDSDPENDNLTIDSVTQPENGFAEIINGQIVYTPDAGFVGTDTFTYTISDGHGGTATATETVTVVGTDTSVIATNDLATTDAGSAVTIDVLANDDTDATITRIVTAPSNGTAVINNGQIVYTPDAGFSGTDTFTYEVRDPAGNLATATVTVTVNAPANGINAAADQATTGRNTPVTIDVLSNDDADATLTGVLTQPANGTVSIVNGQVVYTPNAGYVGTDTFTYEVTDPQGNKTTAEVTVTVTAQGGGGLINAAPDQATTPENTPVTIDVLSNDDADATLTGVLTQPANGTVSIVNGKIVYTPNAGYNGTDTFTYQVTDPQGNMTTTNVTVTVTGSVVAAPDQATTTAGSPVTINVLDNDDSDATITRVVTQPGHGTAAVVNGEIVYTPNAGYVGTDTFTYEVKDPQGNLATTTVTVTVTPDGKINAADDSRTTDENTPVTIDVLSNDDADATLTGVLTQPANGTASIVNGKIVYTPNTGYNGTDTFTYEVTDPQGNKTTATVSVTVQGAIHAADDSKSTNENTPVTIDVLSNDDADATLTGVLTQPANGTVSVVNGKIVYTPNTGYNGTDTFTYEVTDPQGNKTTATVSVTVVGAIHAADDSKTTNENTPVTIDVLSNDDADATLTGVLTQPANGSVSVVNGKIVYTPNNNFNGTDTFTYEVTDPQGNKTTASVTVTVNGKVNAANDSKVTDENTPVTINVLSNDDADATLTGVLTQPANGSVSVVGGKIVYTPNNGFNGTDSFTYEVTDPQGNKTTASVTVTVNGKIDATNDKISTNENTPVTIDVLSNDDADAALTGVVSQPANGSVSVVGSKIVYTPNTGFSGTDSFTYEVVDPQGNKTTATVTVTVQGVINATDDYENTDENTPVKINVLSNDDSDATLTGQLSQPSNGSAQIVGNQIVYTPNNGFTGLDSFSYEVTDASGNKTDATVFVTVNAVNTAPIANDDSATTGCSAVTIPVLNNDSDDDGDVLDLLTVSGMSLGTAVISGNNIVYTPASDCDKGNIGTDNFSYTITDGHGHTVIGGISVDVQGVGCNAGCTKANTDEAWTTEGQPVTINVLANDDGKTTLTVINTDYIDPNKGSATIVGNQVHFTPAAGFTGIVTFGYDIEDVSGYQDYATIVVYVENAQP